MRSSKSRSRSKSNRNRSMGNIVNRVFDSSGPEGKVRGTPQQIIDKYNQLARDAQLSNDRVAFENFQQHAEHYTRMLGEAMREQEAQRGPQGSDQPTQQQQQQHGQRQPQGEDQRRNVEDQRRNGEDQRRNGEDRAPEPQFEHRPRREEEPRRDDDVIDVAEDEVGGLVETPESASQARPEPAPAPEAAPQPAPQPAAAEAPPKPRRPRRPRKTEPAESAEPKPEAAE